MESQREIFNQAISEHADKIRYLHSFGEGSRFGIIYITEDDEAFGVGYNGDFNLLCGRGESFLKKKLEKPEKIPELCGKGVWAVHIGDHKGLALGAHGMLYQWGLPFSKIRSVYDTSSIHLPDVKSCVPDPISNVGCGGGFFAVITEKKKVFMWGHIDWSAPFSDGRLFSPMHKEVESISCGAWHVTMLTTDGKVYTFGHGGYGQLGYDWSENDGFWRVEELPSVNEPWMQTDAGSVSSMFMSKSGELWACGLNHPQFGRLGVDSEVATITKPIRVKIDEPLSEVCCSWTLCALHSVYAARSANSTKIYVWGWGFESKHPQPYEGATSMHDVFNYMAVPYNLGDRFKFKKKEQSHTFLKLQPVHSLNKNPMKINNHARIVSNLPNPCPKITQSVREPTINDQINNLKNTNSTCRPAHSDDKNRLFSEKSTPFSLPAPKTSPEVAFSDKSYKSYLDYVYSGGSKQLEFREIIEVLLLAVHYEESQLIEHTFNQIKSRVNERNFPVLLEICQTHQSDVLKKIAETFIKNLCKQPQKVADLILSLKIQNNFCR